MGLLELIISGLWILFGFYLIFIIFLLIGTFRLKSFSINNNFKVSVIVPFRNEGKKLRRCIESILSQNFERERFEIIVVNDHSTDDSAHQIQDYIDSGQVRLINLSDGSGKKKAIEEGIKNSKHEIIVTTDADCVQSRNWLKSMVDTFDDKTGFVAGKIVYSEGENIFEEIQKIEFASLVSIASAFIGNKIPLLANGANCAYRKSLFYDVGGFKDNINLASGDEEFLMQKIYFDSNYEVRFCLVEDSVVFTKPIATLPKFINQRKRWVSKVPYYRNKLLLPVLSLLYLFYILFSLSTIGILFYPKLSNTLFQIFLIKMIADLIFLLRGYQILELSKNKIELIKLILTLPLAEMFHFIYITIVPVLNYLTGFEWKGRKFEK